MTKTTVRLKIQMVYIWLFYLTMGAAPGHAISKLDYLMRNNYILEITASLRSADGHVRYQTENEEEVSFDGVTGQLEVSLTKGSSQVSLSAHFSGTPSSAGASTLETILRDIVARASFGLPAISSAPATTWNKENYALLFHYVRNCSPQFQVHAVPGHHYLIVFYPYKLGTALMLRQEEGLEKDFLRYLTTIPGLPKPRSMVHTTTQQGSSNSLSSR